MQKKKPREKKSKRNLKQAKPVTTTPKGEKPNQVSTVGHGDFWYVQFQKVPVCLDILRKKRGHKQLHWVHIPPNAKLSEFETGHETPVNVAFLIVGISKAPVRTTTS